MSINSERLRRFELAAAEKAMRGEWLSVREYVACAGELGLYSYAWEDSWWRFFLGLPWHRVRKEFRT